MSKLYVIPTPIGNLGDMTPRSIEALKESDIILAEDTRNSMKLMNVFEIKSKMLSYHKFNEEDRSHEIIDRMKNEDIIVSIITDAGTPCVSDPGYILVNEAREKGIEVVGFAGACASIVALSISGIKSDKFAFYGFLARKDKGLKEDIDRIMSNSIKTFIIYESPKRVENLFKILKDKMPNSKFSLCKELTKLHEHVDYDSAEKIYDLIKEDANYKRGEYVIIGRNMEETSVEENQGYSKVSLEAKIFDFMYSEKVSMKDAIKMVAKKEHLSKSEVFDASLKLKSFLEFEV